MPSRLPPTTTRSFSTAIRAGPSKCISRKAARSQITNTRPAIITNNSEQLTIQLPLRARLHQAATIQQAAELNSAQTEHNFPPSVLQSTHSITSSNPTNSQMLATKPAQSKPLVLSKSLQALLPSLCAQKPHYITAHIHKFPYLLQTGDTLRLPFHMKGVSPGDILRLNRASVLGSRDYTLKAGTSSKETYDQKRTGEPNYLDERLFEVRARIMGVESGPIFVKEKTKRRNRRVKTVKSKHRYTVLKVMEVRVKDVDELMRETGTVLLES